jgi:hypothetical protein
VGEKLLEDSVHNVIPQIVIASAEKEMLLDQR